jgi:hypothetical protein
MQSKAATVTEYLKSLPEDRRAAVAAVREVILKNLDEDYEEGMSYGMIGYCVPHRIFPAGYHCNPAQPLPYAGLASQKGHLSLYLMSIYGHQPLREWFEKAWKKTGKKLDMGKSCIRFKRVEDVPLEVIGEAIRRVPAKAYIEHYRRSLGQMGKASAAKGKPATRGAAKSSARSTTKKKVKKKQGRGAATRS